MNIYNITGHSNGQLVSAVLESFIVDIGKKCKIGTSITESPIFYERMKNELTYENLKSLEQEAKAIYIRIRKAFPTITEIKWNGRDVQGFGDIRIVSRQGVYAIELKRTRGNSNGTLKNLSANTSLSHIFKDVNVSGYIGLIRGLPSVKKAREFGYVVKNSGLAVFTSSENKRIMLENPRLYQEIVDEEARCRSMFINTHLANKSFSDNIKTFVKDLYEADMMIYLNYNSDGTFRVRTKKVKILNTDNLSLGFSDDSLGFSIYNGDKKLFRCALYWKNRVGNNFALNIFEN